jgi:hypothetical protein
VLASDVHTLQDEILNGTKLPSQVWEMLNGLWGYRTRPTKASKGGPLSRTSFYDLLSNPFYYGLCRERDLVYPGIHPPLISETEFGRTRRATRRCSQTWL